MIRFFPWFASHRAGLLHKPPLLLGCLAAESGEANVVPVPGAGAGGARSGGTLRCTAALSPSVQKVLCALEFLPTQGAVQKSIAHVFAVWGLCWPKFGDRL